MSSGGHLSSQGHGGTPSRRKFGLIPSEYEFPRQNSPLASPNKISLEDYEREGREETRKELAALFEHLSANPGVTEHLPHITQAMKENGKSSAQTARLKNVRSPQRQTSKGFYIGLVILIVALIAIGGWFSYSKLLRLSSLPSAALGTSQQLLQALHDCTEHPERHGIASVNWNREGEHTEGQFNAACVNLIDPATRASPLILASGEGNLDNVLLLIKAGAKVDAVDRLGNSALHYSADGAIVSALLSAGADASAANQRGKNALFTVKSESALLTLLRSDPRLILAKESNTGMTALIYFLRTAQQTRKGPYVDALTKASTLINAMSHEYVPTIATTIDLAGESAIQILLQLTTAPNIHKQVLPVSISSIFAQTLLRLSEYVSTAEQSVIKEDVENAKKVCEAVSRLSLASSLVKADKIGSISAILASSLTTNNKRAKDVLVGRFLILDKKDAFNGRYPISFANSDTMVRFMLDHGAKLYETQVSKGETAGDSVRHILKSIDASSTANIRRQYELIKYIVEHDPVKIEKEMAAVPAAVRTAIERRLLLLNSETLEWTPETLLLGLELLSMPSHQQYQRLPMRSQDYAEFKLLLEAKTSAQFDVSVLDVPVGAAQVIEFQANSAIDNVILDCNTNGALQTLSSGNSFFGAMPRIRLPIDRRSLNSTDPMYKITITCGNLFSACKVDYKIQSFIADENNLEARTPIVNSFFDAALNIYSIARIAALLWLPVSMLPRGIPIILRFLPFFVSLIGFYPAGPVYILYWAGYTTITHLVTRLIFSKTKEKREKR